MRFHFKKETDGKYQIWFESKDHVVLENAINKAINDIMKDPKKAKEEIGFVAKHSLEEMCADSWRWQQNNPNGYGA